MSMFGDWSTCNTRPLGLHYSIAIHLTKRLSWHNSSLSPAVPECKSNHIGDPAGCSQDCEHERCLQEEEEGGREGEVVCVWGGEKNEEGAIEGEVECGGLGKRKEKGGKGRIGRQHTKGLGRG